MKITNEVLNIKTKKDFEFIDITDKIEEWIRKKQFRDGQVLIYSFHTTMAIRVNEKESGFFKDFEEFFKRTFPKDKYYRHNDLNVRTENLVCADGSHECLNGHSHCSHLFLSTSETMPIVDGKLALGKWQKVLAIELDGPRERKISLQFIG